MCVKSFYRMLRIISAVVLFFFVWSFGPVWQVVAFAVEKKQRSAVNTQPSGEKQKADSRKLTADSSERFEKALQDIREKVGKAEEKESRNQDITAEVAEVKKKRIEIEALDTEFKKEFAATEKKLKDAKLPKEILDRHTKFVKHYDDNLKQLKAEIDDIEKATSKADKRATRQALFPAKAHLEKTKPVTRHQKLDPNKLPHRTVKVKERAPRLKKEQFEKDFPPQRSPRTQRTAWAPPISPFDKGGQEGDLISATHESQWDADEPPIESFEGRRGKGGLTRISTNGLKHHASEFKPILLAYNGDLGALSLSGYSSASPHQPLNASPQHAFTLQPFDASTSLLLAQAVTNPPTADDLAETPEIQFTQSIKDLAVQLGNKPVKIYEWVRNNIEFIPTYGSIQGADMCLQTKQCNALDTNALLAALMRVSNIPARFSYETIEVPINKVMNWAGGFADPKAAVSMLASGGIPVKAYVSGGVITKVQMETAWLEIYIPYGNYRGAIMDNSNKTWIPMDGSFKQYTYTNGFDITAAVPFDSNAYMSQVQSQNPVHYYQSRIQNYLDANTPDTSIIDVKGYREITQEKYHFLPSTLPFITVAKLGKFSSVPENMAAKVTVTLSSPDTGSDVSYTVSTPEIAGKRVTISYIPATANDEALIVSYGGFLYNVPAYMLNLKPILRVEGVIKLTGDAVTLGSEQSMTIQFIQPSGMNESINKKLIAGAYYAVGMDLQGINENVLGKRNYQMTTNVLSETAGTLGNDDLIGEHLFILATMYHLANDKIYKSAAKLYNAVVTRTLSEGITSFTLSVSHLFAMPKSAMPSGINIDVAMDRVIAIAKDGDVSKEKAYMDISGLVSSYHEHDIFEKIDGFSSVSAVRALQVASANGIAIQHVTSANIAQMLPTLQVSAEIKTDIQNAVNAGREVTIPQTNVQIHDWNGVGYIAKDPLTGSGTYMISGGLAGGDSTSNKDGMQVVEIFKGAYAWIKNILDLLTRRNIVTAASLQIGEEILADAATIREVGVSYGDIGKCTGLVIQSYAAAGIDLVKKSKDAGFGNPYNVSVLYLYVKSKTEFAVGSEGPIWGDIIFFKNTYERTSDMRRPGDNNVTHVGIVTSVLDGEVYSMTHSSSKRNAVIDVILEEGLMHDPTWSPFFLDFGRPR